MRVISLVLVLGQYQLKTTLTSHIDGLEDFFLICSNYGYHCVITGRAVKPIKICSMITFTYNDRIVIAVVIVIKDLLCSRGLIIEFIVLNV